MMGLRYVKKIWTYIINPAKVFFLLREMHILDKMSDKKYISFMYRAIMGKRLCLYAPKTFNEKIQWIKLYDHKEIYNKMVDKYEAKYYASSIIGPQYLIENYGVWDRFDDIDFSSLPERFVLKCTHDSGSVVFCKDKTKFDFQSAKQSIDVSLRTNHYLYGREWAYKNIKPRIIAEELLVENEFGLMDYKFFCFNGKPLFMYVSRGLDDHSTAEMSFFDLELNELPFHRSDYKQIGSLISIDNLEEMISIAQKLARDTIFIRVDLYNIRGQVYFSELTLYPNAGFIPFEPEEWDRKLGDLLELPLENR